MTMYRYVCTHCGFGHVSPYPPPMIAFHHADCSQKGHYNTMKEMKDETSSDTER
jgi:hypothetical protein